MWKALLKRLKHLLERRRQVRQLRAMDQRMLNDLAISRADAERLAGRYRTHDNDSLRDSRWKR